MGNLALPRFLSFTHILRSIRMQTTQWNASLRFPAAERMKALFLI